MVHMQTREKELIMLRAIHHAQQGEYDKAIACIQLIINDEPNDSTAWFNKGHTLRLAGRIEEADELLKNLHEEHPDRADICFELGLLAKVSENLNEAEDFFLKCIHLEPLSSEPRVELGSLFYKNQNFEKAKKYFADALVFDPGNISVMLHLGLIAQKLGKFEEAERWFYESSEHDSSDTETWYNLARLYEEQGRKSDEIACYDKLIALDPEQLVPWLKKGLCYLISDELTKSIACFRMATHLDSDSHLPYLLSGLVYSILDKNEEAVKSLETAVSLSDGPEVMLQYGRALGACEQYEKALQVFSDIIRSHPENRAAAEGYARSLYLLRRYDEVASFCLLQMELDPENPFWVTTYARVHGWHLGETDKAIVALQEGMNQIPGLQIPIVLSDLLVFSGRTKEARELLLSLESEHPQDCQVLSRLSSLLAQMKEFEQSIRYFDKLIEQQPHDSNLVYLAGQACEQSGDPDRALVLYTDAITKMPENPEIWLSRARVLMDLGFYQDAAFSAAQAADIRPDWYDAFLLKGMAEIHTEDYANARKSLTCATTLDRKNPEAWGYLGDALYLSGEKPAAKICYERALALDPEDTRFVVRYRACLEKLVLDRVTKEESILNENLK
ncbi:tetratricopeptide repeat protein [Methanospirillum stamsii]|uniref:Uncharacterized protein n=1 Tax=Methanospirillum stamsii TaxID=1277351 RepID=A0A2V2MV75_9EURY|nr:tetratricopeptide repeat protein [Methanospirillum stamsii]PWR71812.1 hypothetical protein DLD82_13105 [Methanospirillum stamsii]